MKTAGIRPIRTRNKKPTYELRGYTPFKSKWEQHVESIPTIAASYKPLFVNDADARFDKWVKTNARRLAQRALKSGQLKKQPCYCGAVPAEAHHRDYLKALEVEWLCKRHHVEADKKRRAIDKRAIPTLAG